MLGPASAGVAEPVPSKSACAGPAENGGLWTAHQEMKAGSRVQTYVGRRSNVLFSQCMRSEEPSGHLCMIVNGCIREIALSMMAGIFCSRRNP